MKTLLILWAALGLAFAQVSLVSLETEQPENDLKWKIENKVFDDISYGDNNVPKELKKQFKTYAERARYATQRYYRLDYLQKVKEKHNGEIHPKLEQEIKKLKKEQAAQVKKEIKFYESFSKRNAYQEAQLAALKKSGSLEHASLAGRAASQGEEFSTPLSEDEKKYLKLFNEGKSQAEIYDQVVANFEESKKNEEKFIEAEKNITYDPKQLKKWAQEDVSRYDSSANITCGHPGRPCPVDRWNKKMEENYKKIQEQTGKDLRGIDKEPPLRSEGYRFAPKRLTADQARAIFQSRSGYYNTKKEETSAKEAKQEQNNSQGENVGACEIAPDGQSCTNRATGVSYKIIKQGLENLSRLGLPKSEFGRGSKKEYLPNLTQQQRTRILAGQKEQ